MTPSSNGSKKTAAIYARVSTSDQSNENQVLQLRQFALSQGWEVVLEYSDEVSGAKSERERPAFRAMFDAASKRTFDILLFWSLDRLSREGVLPTLQYLNRLTSYGIAWRSYTEQYIDSCGIFSDVVVSIMAAIARQERVRRSERTRAGLARARANGKRLGRRKVQVVSEEVSKLRRDGFTWSKISNRLGVSRRTCQRLLQSVSACRSA